MVQADADLLRTAAAIDHDALQIVKQLQAIGAPQARIKDAQQNSLNAGNLLRLAIERWMRTI